MTLNELYQYFWNDTKWGGAKKVQGYIESPNHMIRIAENMMWICKDYSHNSSIHESYLKSFQESNFEVLVDSKLIVIDDKVALKYEET